MLFVCFAVSGSKSRAKSKGYRPLFDQYPFFFDEFVSSLLLVNLEDDGEDIFDGHGNAVLGADLPLGRGGDYADGF